MEYISIGGYMKLSEYAKKHGLTYRTAFNHFTNGKIPNAYQLESGTIVVPDESIWIIIEGSFDVIEDIVNYCKNKNVKRYKICQEK